MCLVLIIKIVKRKNLNLIIGDGLFYQKTIESLVYYEDIEATALDTPESINKSIESYQDTLAELKAKLSAADGARNRIENYLNLIRSRGFDIESLPDDLESCLEYQDLMEKTKCYQSDIDYYTGRINGYNTRLAEIKYSMSQYNSIISAPDTCPYCDISCSSLDATRERAQEQLVALQEELDEVNSQIAEASNLMSTAKQHLDSAERQILAYKQAVETWLPEIRRERETANADTTYINEQIEFCKESIRTQTDLLAKVKANKQYEELSETIAKDKMIAETRAEVLKVLAKLTDVNGMQTAIMESPFTAFSDEISEIYSEIMNDESKFAFNLESKANSFGFGIIRDGAYIGFDYLSSGEKCLVTLSLLVGIVLKSNAKLKILLIDDMLDHLDAERSALCFDALYKLCEAHDIQIIAAGVIPCDHPKASEFTIHVGG